MNCSSRLKTPLRHYKASSRVRMGFRYDVWLSILRAQELRLHPSESPPLHSTSLLPSSIQTYAPNSEPDVKLVDLADTTKISFLKGHTKAVRRATWHPSGSLLVRRVGLTLGFGGSHMIRPRVGQMARLSCGMPQAVSPSRRRL